jgi:DNA-binding NarL/FixJ family response regulator
MTTVLVVEDEIEIARVVRDYLDNAGFEVIVVGDGGSAIASVRSVKPDLLVLDLGLPGRDGLDVAREIRRWSNTPIVMLTARGDETDRVVGLELGADDYVVKPFFPEELAARVRSLLARSGAYQAAGVGTGETANLTERERQVLQLLAEGLTQTAIAGELYISPKTVGTHIQRILTKLGVHSRAEAVASAFRLRLVDTAATHALA